MSRLIHVRVKKNDSFITINRFAVNNKNLSWAAKGLHLYLMSRTANWKIRQAELLARSTDGRGVLRRATEELKSEGLLEINKVKNEFGLFCSYEWTVYEKPITSIYSESTKSESRKPRMSVNDPSSKKQDKDSKILFTKTEPQEIINSFNLDSNKEEIRSNKKQKEDAPIGVSFLTQIISYLNERARTNYRPSTPKTIVLIKARMKEGFSVDDFKTVIDKKAEEWRGTDFEKYLRPETLFGTKFEGYLNQQNGERKLHETHGEKQARLVREQFGSTPEAIARSFGYVIADDREGLPELPSGGAGP